MAPLQARPEKQPQPTQTSNQPKPSPVLDGRQPAEPEEPFLRLNCSSCKARFVLDLEEWQAAPEESEIVGRDFLGIPADATLCPHCLRQVQLAGAEHIYWRYAHA